MKALVLEDYMKLVYKDVPDPVPGKDEVLVNVKAVGICGSDVHGMDGSSGRRIPPVIMGHEASGVIEDTGKEVKEWKSGDRVTFDSTIYRLDDWYSRRGLYNLSNGRKVFGVSAEEFRRDGCFAEYVTVPQHILYRIPEDLGFTQAAMTEPAAVAMHAAGLTPVSLNDTAVVVGAGMIGIFVIQLLRINGCGKVIAVDTQKDRLDMALKLGASHAFDPAAGDIRKAILELSEERGADIAFDAAGIQATVTTAVHSLRKGGTLTLIGNVTPRVEIPLQTVVNSQLRLQGSYAISGEYPAVLDLMSGGALQTAPVLSAEAPLSEGAEWFHRLYRKEKGLMKVILIP